jgi:hypothetical protein
MEITMQWLDDLEDLIFASAFAWHRLCRFCLTPGFAASLLVMALDHTLPVLITLSAIALVSVLAWLTAVTSTLVCATRALAVSA